MSDLIGQLACRLGVDREMLVSAVVEALAEEQVARAKLPSSSISADDRLAYSVVEAAKRLGVSADLVRSAIDRGEIAARRVGRRVLIPARELRRLLGEAA